MLSLVVRSLRLLWSWGVWIFLLSKTIFLLFVLNFGLTIIYLVLSSDVLAIIVRLFRVLHNSALMEYLIILKAMPPWNPSHPPGKKPLSGLLTNSLRYLERHFGNIARFYHVHFFFPYLTPLTSGKLKPAIFEISVCIYKYICACIIKGSQ